MNKALKICPIAVFSLLSISATPLPEGVTLTCSQIGPFTVLDGDYQLSVKLTSYRSYSNVQVRIYLGIKGEGMSYVYTTSSQSISTRKSATVKINLPLETMLTTKGIEGRFECMINASVKNTYPFSLMPVSYPTINVSDYIDTDYVVEDVIVHPLYYEEKHLESYKFRGFIDYFNEDNYYRLHLDNLYIDYDCFRPFPGAIAFLHFTDYNRVFPYLDNDDEIPSFDIPLRVIYEDSTVIFEYPQTMYVNPKTLEMSLNPETDMVATSHFYLPRNKLSSLVDQDFYLNVSSFGYGCSSFSWKMRYVNNRNLIGDCSNSDYCVVGEVE